LYKTFLLQPWWEQHSRFWVTRNDAFALDLLKKEKVYFGNFPENRNVVNAIRNFFLAWILLRKEKPDAIFSMGAGIAPPFFLVAKILGIRTIFLETFIFIQKPTLSGRMIYFIADHFLIQHKKLLTTYPRATYCGTLL